MKSNAMRSTQWQCAVVSSWLLLAHPLWAGETPTTEASPLTVAEKSGFRATSRSAEVIEFINTIAHQADHVRSFEFGRTVEDRSLMCTVVTQPPVREASALANDPRLVVLLIGNIHSGECAGKEALLMLLRELSHEPDDQWLHNLILLFVPNYNADGNDAVSRDNRPGQVGPAAGMGRRENAQGLDLNRDYMKLDTPECRALVGLINQWDPGLVIDMHTTNGSQHRYALTYDVPHNPASPASLRGFMRQEMMPAITSTLEHQGVATFYYGNFNRDHTRWTTFGDAPRYGTEYVGLRGRMSILSEAYAYITYEERIKASRVRQAVSRFHRAACPSDSHSARPHPHSKQSIHRRFRQPGSCPHPFTSHGVAGALQRAGLRHAISTGQCARSRETGGQSRVERLRRAVLDPL